MTDLKLAAQKALEAWDEAVNYVRDGVRSPWLANECEAAMTVLRSALQHQEEREPVTWAIFDSQGYYDARDTEEHARWFCDYCNKRGDDPLKPYTYRPLYATPPLLQKEEGVRVLNALDVLNRMGLGPQDTAPAETFLRILGERGMWVIDAAIATRQGEKPSA